MKNLTLRREFKIPEERKGRLQVMSSGGGTQSNCIIVLIAMGALPKPDIVIMSNTEREASNVFEYQEKYIKPICDEIGLEYVIINKSDYTKHDISYINESGEETTLPPFFSEFNGRNQDGTIGKQPGFCSSKWKSDVLNRYLNKRYGEKELTKRGVDYWIGMSFDEKNRVKYPTGKWQKRYPLFEAQILREQAIKIVEEFGLPEPPRSACWMCPNRHDDEWQWMKENVPEDFERAVKFEKELQKDFEWLWLHRTGEPLSDLDFKKLSRSSKQIDIFEKYCDTGLCFV